MVMEPVIEDAKTGPAHASAPYVNPITYLLQFLSLYGWYLVGIAAVVLYLVQRLRPTLEAWRQAREDAEYHKDPDKSLARMEAIQRARERQQQQLLAASESALQLQIEREERKRAEAAARLAEREDGDGHRLGGAGDDGYLPLSGSGAGSSYRAPRRSACSRGGCGR